MTCRSNLYDESVNLNLYPPGSRLTKYTEIFLWDVRPLAEASDIKVPNQDNTLVIKSCDLKSCVVDIPAENCGCSRFQVNEIPCEHATTLLDQ